MTARQPPGCEHQADTYEVLSVEWATEWPDEPGVDAGPMTIIRVHGHVPNVGAGDRIAYVRPAPAPSPEGGPS